MIANVLSKVRYIEELGEGWDKIMKEHRIHPLNPELPKIESDEFSTLVTLFSTRERFERERRVELNKRQKKALGYVDECGRITTSDYRMIFPNISDRTALRDLKDMVDKNLLEPKGKKKGRYYVLK